MEEGKQQLFLIQEFAVMLTLKLGTRSVFTHHGMELWIVQFECLRWSLFPCSN